MGIMLTSRDQARQKTGGVEESCLSGSPHSSGAPAIIVAVQAWAVSAGGEAAVRAPQGLLLALYSLPPGTGLWLLWQSIWWDGGEKRGQHPVSLPARYTIDRGAVPAWLLHMDSMGLSCCSRLLGFWGHTGSLSWHPGLASHSPLLVILLLHYNPPHTSTLICHNRPLDKANTCH